MPVAKDRLGALQVCKLIQCVRERNKDQIGKLVRCGIPYLVNYGEPYEGETPLIIAAKENDIDMIKFLTQQMGALPDFGDLTGATPAMRAAELGLDEALAALAEAGANMRACDTDGKSVLFYCLQPTEEHARCLALALANEADVNWPAKDGRTAFFAACEAAVENPDACKRLLEAGAVAEVVQVGSRRTALMAACACGSDEVTLAALRRGADPNSADRQGWTPAHHAARAGHIACLFRLSAFGADFDRTDGRQANPLHTAAAAGQAMCVKFLGQRGASAKAKNADGKTPRLLAKEAKASKACMREVRRVERLQGKTTGKNNEPWALALYDWTLARGEELQARLLADFDPEATGQVALEDLVQVLGSLGAPWTPECEKKLGPLYDKAKNGAFDYKDFLTGRKYIAKLYLATAFEKKKKKKGKKGKKGGRKKKKARYPFEVCVLPDEQVMRPANGAPPVMYVPRAVSLTDQASQQAPIPTGQPRLPGSALQDDSSWYATKLAKSFVSLNDCAKHGDLESVRLALRKGYGTETADKLSKTPLMVAAHYGNMDVARFLLEAGANVNARDNFLWTPLHHACHTGLPEMAELLLRHGAQTEAVALNGSTPLLRAIETGNLQLVDLLLKYGAKASVENKMGQMIHEVAANWGSPKIADYIKAKYPKMTTMDPKKRGGAKKKGKAR